MQQTQRNNGARVITLTKMTEPTIVRNMKKVITALAAATLAASSFGIGLDQAVSAHSGSSSSGYNTGGGCTKNGNHYASTGWANWGKTSNGNCARLYVAVCGKLGGVRQYANLYHSPSYTQPTYINSQAHLYWTHHSGRTSGGSYVGFNLPDHSGC